MTLNQSALLELSAALKAADAGEMMRMLLDLMLKALVDAEVTSVIGAGPHERTTTRTTQRNGTRDKTVSTTAGDHLTVRISKTRAADHVEEVLPATAAKTA